jgi:hypothetical protein
MKTLNHIEGWFCIYDKQTKKLLVAARPLVPGGKTTYDESKVEVLTAPTEAELLEAIAAL